MSNLTTWKLKTTETGKSCGDNSGSTFKVFIAKLIPLIQFAKPKEKTIAISKSCFINDTKCKPSISAKVSTRNYIEIPLDSGSGIYATKTYPIKHGTKLKIHSENIDTLTVKSKA